jgi:hypothetical protein
VPQGVLEIPMAEIRGYLPPEGISFNDCVRYFKVPKEDHTSFINLVKKVVTDDKDAKLLFPKYRYKVLSWTPGISMASPDTGVPRRRH